ncbi:SAV_6107 family HEPN domain-containing protein [Streptomyces sp. NPDC047108]|uniref:SAV_6107 family HEPN domain-containing protein n=1 Tax=Streptomyces sp. NPDC047108 TaxID=3155025 RepID=UPI0033F5A369
MVSPARRPSPAPEAGTAPSLQSARRRRAPRPDSSTPRPDSVQSGSASDVHPVVRRDAAPPEALGLLAQAHKGLGEAAELTDPNERYATAHLAALRIAAAVLAVRGRPEPPPPRRGSAASRRRRPIRSAWEVLPEVAPELAEWSLLFASGADRRARAEAGIEGAAGHRDADDLLRDAGMFLRIVERMLLLRPVLPPSRTADASDEGWAPGSTA